MKLSQVMYLGDWVRKREPSTRKILLIMKQRLVRNLIRAKNLRLQPRSNVRNSRSIQFNPLCADTCRRRYRINVPLQRCEAGSMMNIGSPAAAGREERKQQQLLALIRKEEFQGLRYHTTRRQEEHVSDCKSFSKSGNEIHICQTSLRESLYTTVTALS